MFVKFFSEQIWFDFGIQCLESLVSKVGFHVIPVNKKEDFIQNTKCYKSVEDIGVKPDILNFVVPPQIGYEMTKDLVTLGFNNFWYQPGAESESTSLFLKENKKNYIDDKCIMVEAKFN